MKARAIVSNRKRRTVYFLAIFSVFSGSRLQALQMKNSNAELGAPVRIAKSALTGMLTVFPANEKGWSSADRGGRFDLSKGLDATRLWLLEQMGYNPKGFFGLDDVAQRRIVQRADNLIRQDLFEHVQLAKAARNGNVSFALATLDRKASEFRKVLAPREVNSINDAIAALAPEFKPKNKRRENVREALAARAAAIREAIREAQALSRQ